MAEKFKPQTFDINSINGGNRYQNGQGIDADSINSAIEASAYAQALATNQPDTTNATNFGTPSVSIQLMQDGTPQFKFENLQPDLSQYATVDDIDILNDKVVENTEKIKVHEQVLFQSGIVGVLEKSQAYTARETAEGANIVDGQTTPVLEIAGDTVVDDTTGELKNAFINSIKSTGTNLFNPSLYDGIETNADKMATTKVYVNNATPVLFKGEPNTEYTIAIYDTDKNASGFNGFSFNANGTWINSNNKAGVFTTNENGEIYLQAGASSYTTIGRTGYVAIFKGKYNFSVLPNYEPYTENTYQLPETLELGKWDKLNPQTGVLTRGTGTVTSETAFTEEQIASYKNAIVSADGLSLAYELDIATISMLTGTPKNYIAWKNGSETIVQGDTDNSVYGAMPTITQTYFELLGGTANE